MDIYNTESKFMEKLKLDEPVSSGNLLTCLL